MAATKDSGCHGNPPGNDTCDEDGTLGKLAHRQGLEGKRREIQSGDGNNDELVCLGSRERSSLAECSLATKLSHDGVSAAVDQVFLLGEDTPCADGIDKRIDGAERRT